MKYLGTIINPSRNPLLLWILPLSFLGIFYFFPLFSIWAASFARQEGTLAAPFIEALTTPSIQRVVGFTIWQATLSTLLTIIVGLPGAYLLARYEFRGKSLIQALTSIPFIMPTLVVATAFNALLGPRGWLNMWLMNAMQIAEPPIHFVNSFGAILTAHVFYNTTIILRMVGDFWSRLDPRMEQAARTLGANRWRVFYHVTLPLLAPAIATAALLVFIFNFTSFGVILVLGGPHFATLEVEIYYQTISLFNLPIAAALSIIQLVCTLVLTIIYTHFSTKLSHPLTLRSRQITQQRLNTWRKRISAFIFLALLLGLLTMPLIALAARSVSSSFSPGQPQSGLPALTFDYYRELTINRLDSLFFTTPSTAVGVSLTYASITAILALVLGLPASWALTRNTGSILNKVFDPILMLPLGTSAVTLGLGFIVGLNQPPLDLRASPILIPLAHTLVAFPFVVRSLTPALRSIRPNLRHAAAVMGAAPYQVVRHIDIPLVGRALIVAATFAFTISLGEFGATALISRPEYPTIPVMIYRFISQPGSLNYGKALALSTILMITTAVGMLAIERLRIAEIGEF